MRAETTDALRVENLTVRFGNLVAVNDVSLRGGSGEITGIIGPNGAGKTTLFNACSGLVRPTRGRVYLADQDMTFLVPADRARQGLGRTFQVMDLFDNLTVEENVWLGREAALAGRNPLMHVLRPHRQRTELRAGTEEALVLCGIEGLRRRRAGDLSTGERRLVELARAVAGRFQLLLLDEPSSGLDREETNQFGEILRRVVQGAQTIVLVEHDMSLVMAVCDYIFVLDFGQLIFQGIPAEVRSSEAVRAVYLGTEVA